MRRLLGIYAVAFAALIAPLSYDARYAVLSIAAVASLRNPVPVLLPAIAFFWGENIAVQFPDTWTYDVVSDMPGLHVPLWLLPLWILAAQFCCDACCYVK